MRQSHFIFCVALAASAVLSGCRSDDQTAQNGTNGSTSTQSNDRMLPSGTSVDVTLNTRVTSENASVGDAWSGTTRGATDMIPAGSPVSGTVTGVTPARKGDRAMLDLGLTSIVVDGHSYRISGGMESVVAGSTRARNLGAIGAATAAGAIVGQAVGGSTKSTVIGAVVGGGAATGVVSQTKGYQVVLKEGTPLTFTTREAVAVRS